MEKNPKSSTLKLFFAFIFCFVPLFGRAEEPSQSFKGIENLENLIVLTEQNLEELKSLKLAVAEFQKLQTLFLDHPNNKELLMKTGKSAKKVLETIKEMHLIHVFDAKFLSELSLFVKMVKKPSLPKS